MKRVLLWLLLLPCAANAQNEDDFLPTVKLLVIDSPEVATQRFCKEIISTVGGFKLAFTDRENVMMTKYMYDNADFQTVKFDFQFVIDETMAPDSTIKRNRVVRYMSITADLPVMARIYSYLFNETYTPDKLMTISANDKAINYKGSTYSAKLISDDFKAGYWVLSFYKL